MKGGGGEMKQRAPRPPSSPPPFLSPAHHAHSSTSSSVLPGRPCLRLISPRRHAPSATKGTYSQALAHRARPHAVEARGEVPKARDWLMLRKGTRHITSTLALDTDLSGRGGACRGEAGAGKEGRQPPTPRQRRGDGGVGDTRRSSSPVQIAALSPPSPLPLSHPKNTAPAPHAVATHTPALDASGTAPHEHTLPSQAWVPRGGGGVGAVAEGLGGGGGGADMMRKGESVRKCWGEAVFFYHHTGGGGGWPARSLGGGTGVPAKGGKEGEAPPLRARAAGRVAPPLFANATLSRARQERKKGFYGSLGSPPRPQSHRAGRRAPG